MRDFNKNPRRLQELAGRPIADNIYRSIFGATTDIKRAENEDDAVLDKYFAIDVKLTLPSGQILLGQEKFLSHEYANYKSVTVEHYQNPMTGEHGDWFKLAAQFYFIGYLTADRTAFDPWVLIDWLQIVVKTLHGEIQWRNNGNTKSNARASFRYTNMVALPKSCIISSSWLQEYKKGEQMTWQNIS
jgi:hypothetical protein